MTAEMFDVRSIANFVLDTADSRGIEITNMALNKIVFFLHCDNLLEKGEALVGAKIEAWQHGPVFREIYQEFKGWGDAPIKGRATKVDPRSGDVVKAEADLEPVQRDYLTLLLDRYINFTAGQLRAISHTKGGPWHRVWGHDGQANPGMKIGNDLILEYYSSGVRQ